MSKNIETCKSEEVLSSVLDQQPQDYCSVRQAVHDLGVTALPAASAADPDIAELPSNVDVFVRRVLKAVVYDRVLPVVQQMWQAVWLRFADYLPDTLLPYAQDPSLRTLGTLPTALSALAPRKISNGGATSDGIKDGVSLAHILLGSDMTSSVTEIKDDNYNWSLVTNPSITRFVNLVKAYINGEGVIRNSFANASNIALKEVSLTGVEELRRVYAGRDAPFFRCPELEVVYAPDATRLVSEGSDDGIISECPKMKRVVIGTPTSLNRLLRGDMPDIIDVEIGAGTSINLNISEWNPTNVLADADKTATFLQNFLHHIAERLAVGPTTTRLTLTLSANVYSACGFGATIDDQTDIRYQIKKAIQDRNWKVTDGTNNFNQ